MFYPHPTKWYDQLIFSKRSNFHHTNHAVIIQPAWHPHYICQAIWPTCSVITSNRSAKWVIHHLLLLSPLSLIVGPVLCLVTFAMVHKRCEFMCPLNRVFGIFGLCQIFHAVFLIHFGYTLLPTHLVVKNMPTHWSHSHFPHFDYTTLVTLPN